MRGEIRDWAQQLPVGTLIDLDDVQADLPSKSRDAIKVALSRLCRGDDPLLARMSRGIYCRRRVGARYPALLPAGSRTALIWKVAGTGAGVTGPDIINRLGWSTQVPPSAWVSVVGRPPRCTQAGARYVGRSNLKRLGLNCWEVSLLEAVRCFDDWTEITWDEALAKLRRTVDLGYDGDGLRPIPFMDAAADERGLGPDFLGRCKEVASVAGRSTARVGR